MNEGRGAAVAGRPWFVCRREQSLRNLSADLSHFGDPSHELLEHLRELARVRRSRSDHLDRFPLPARADRSSPDVYYAAEEPERGEVALIVLSTGQQSSATPSKPAMARVRDAMS